MNKKNKVSKFNQLSNIEKKIYIKNIIKKYDAKQYPINEHTASAHEYLFWNKQPCPKKESDMFHNGSIIQNGISDVNFSGNHIDEASYANYVIEYNTLDVDEICNFLNIHMYYKNDLKIMYNSGYIQNLLGSNIYSLILKSTDDMKIIGILGGGVKKYKVGNSELELGDVRILCVHKNYRDMGLAEYMMSKYIEKMAEISVNNGIYLTNMYTPIPNSKMELYYRPINYEKIKNSGLYRTSDKKLHEYNMEKYDVVKYKLDNIMPYIEKKHSDHLYELYTEYMNKYNVYWIMDRKYFNKFLSDNHTFVFTDKNKNPVDFVTFQKISVKYNKTLFSTALLLIYTNNSTEYLSCNILNTISYTIKEMGMDMLLLYNNFDSNVLFGEADGFYIKTNVYKYVNFYNWLYPKICTNQIGFI